MKVEKLQDGYFIFFNQKYVGDIPNSKDNIISLVRELLEKKRKLLHLVGFYKVKVYFHENIGIFLILQKLDSLNCDLELKIIVYMNDKIYFKTNNYFILPKNCDVYYYQSYYFCDVKYLSLKHLEFGEYLFGEQLYPYYFLWKKCLPLQ